MRLLRIRPSRERDPRPYGSGPRTALPREPRRFPLPAWESAPRPRRGTLSPSYPSLPQPGLQDLFAMEPGELEILGRARKDRVERHQSDDLALDDLHVLFRRELPDGIEDLDQRRLAVVGHVHRHLHKASIREFK